MHPHVRVTAMLTVAFLLLPLAASAQEGPTAPTAADDQVRPTTEVSFFPHVFAATGAQPMPGNTQFPFGEADFSAGYPDNGCYPESMSALSGVPRVPVNSVPGANIFFSDVYFPTCDDWDQNVLYVYSTAGFVHADPDFWTYEDFHNERGQAKEIVLDTAQDITAQFFMSADYHPWICLPGSVVSGVPSPWPCWNWDPGFFPKWQIEATLFLGSMGEYQGQASEAPPVHEKVASGQVVEVARGVSEPQDMLSLDSSLNNGQGEVYQFDINLGKPLVDRIPKEMDWIMRFKWWARLDDNTKAITGQRTNWNINSGEFYPSHFTLPVKNPFDVELVYPQFLHDKLLLHAMLNSPWGSYDVDSKSVAIDIVGETAGPVAMHRVNRVADFSVAHGGHYKPVNVTWVWDYKADDLKPGVYRVSVTASNFQHSAFSTTSASFRVNADRSGTVLSIGKSGQQTSSEAQLRALEGGSANLDAAAFDARPVAPLTPALTLAALAAAPLLALLLRRRSA
jgi:hypothetical protein